MPESLAACCASATCSAAIHCSQRWKSSSSAWSAASARTESESRPVVRNQSLSHGAPQVSNATHQVAHAVRSSPASATNARNAASRSTLRPCAQIMRSAGSFASHAALMSIGSALLLAAATDACSRSTSARSASLSSAYSGMFCGRIYVTFRNRRDSGKYGEGSSGVTGAHAWIGLMSMKSAPDAMPASATSRLRSP